MSGVYFDSAYLVKCYLGDPDSERVRKLFVNAGTVYSTAICLVEVAYAIHRAVREKAITPAQASNSREAFAFHIKVASLY